VQYKYDAWGKQLAKTGSMASTLGTCNPFRYRGYAYDEETGLYYLRSRYYNTTLVRFINADISIGKKGGVLNYAIYTYCRNNPTSFSDSNGQMYEQSAGGGILDYTQAIDERLNEVISEFIKRSVGDGSPITANDLLLNFENFWWFYTQVDHSAPWDVKEPSSWFQQFPNHYFQAKFFYHDEIITPADLGNFTYGYFGTAMGIDSELLYLMGGVATYTKGKPFGISTLLDAMNAAVSAGAPLYGDWEEDNYWISKGIDAYNAH